MNNVVQVYECKYPGLVMISLFIQKGIRSNWWQEFQDEILRFSKPFFKFQTQPICNQETIYSYNMSIYVYRTEICNFLRFTSQIQNVCCSGGGRILIYIIFFFMYILLICIYISVNLNAGSQ